MHLQTIVLFAVALAIQTCALAKVAREREQADALFNTPRLLYMKIEIAPDGVRSLQQHPRTYVPATITEGDAVYTNVLIRLRGSAGSFRRITDKPGLTIKIQKGAARFHGLKKFHLNNSVQDHTYLNEWLCDDLFRSAGVPSLRVSHTLVELNGRKLGLYLLKESFNKDFLEQYFQNTKGNLYGQSNGADITHPLYRMRGTGADTHADLKALASAAQDPDPARCWQRLQEVLDVDRFLSFLAMEIMLCHRDGYTFGTHNFRVYQNLDSGKMVFLPHDMDQMIGEPNLPIAPRTGALVARAVMRSAEGRARYRERFGFLFTNVFQPSLIAAKIDQYVSVLAPALQEHSPRLASQIQTGARSLKERIRARAAGIEKQLTPQTPQAFENSLAKIERWRMANGQETAELSEASVDGRQVLRIGCKEGGCTASWRATVLLDPGRYRFSARASLVGVVARTDSPNSGVFLRVAHGRRAGGLSGDTDWKLIEREFPVEEAKEIVLICELHALNGEVLFDKDSLRLERMP